jgi:hypothetical protein
VLAKNIIENYGGRVIDRVEKIPYRTVTKYNERHSSQSSIPIDELFVALQTGSSLPGINIVTSTVDAPLPQQEGTSNRAALTSWTISADCLRKQPAEHKTDRDSSNDNFKKFKKSQTRNRIPQIISVAQMQSSRPASENTTSSTPNVKDVWLVSGEKQGGKESLKESPQPDVSSSNTKYRSSLFQRINKS